MRRNKCTDLFVIGIILLWIGMVLNPLDSHARELDFKDGELTIKEIGSSKSEDPFVVQSGVQLSDTIIIDGIVITYAGHSKNDLIVVSNGDTIFKANIKNSLIPSEIKNAGGLILYTNRNYTLSHGDKVWTLNFDGTKTDAEEPSLQETAVTPVDNEEFTDESEKSEKAEESGISSLVEWLILIIIAVLIIAILLSVFICHKKGVFNRRSKNPDNSNDGRQQGQTNGNNKDQNLTLREQNPAPESIEDVLNRIYPTADVYTAHEKESRIIQKLALANEASETKEDLEKVRRGLGLPDGTPVQNMLERIKSLRDGQQEEHSPISDSTEKKKEEECHDNGQQEENNQSPESHEEIKKKVCDDLLEVIANKKNKTLNDIKDKAFKEKPDSQYTSYDRLERFFNILSAEIDKIRKTPSDGTNMDFDQMMNKGGENQIKMKNWALSKISDYGYKLNTNNRIDDTFKEIAQLLNQASSSERHDPNEIIDNAVKDGKFTDDQKKVLLNRLIEKINGHINDSSAKLDSSTSVSDFVVKVAEKVQTPSTHEEAETIVSTNNLNAVNELLESNLTDFDKESLASAFKSVIVKLLNKKLNGFDAQSYDDAMSKLELAVSNSKAADVVLKQFDASGLSELPQAIREKQATELLKSVDNKVNELLPDKHIDSVQKLVNALIKLAEDAKTSNDLIASDLNEKISKRSNENVASDEKDIVDLITKYDAIVTAKERELTTEITNKDGQINKLVASLVKKEEENSILSNKNNDLMSESQTLIESLHFGADSIIENCKTILEPCSDNDESQCNDIEDRLFLELKETVDIFKSFNVGDDVMPTDARAKIQKLLIEELSKENNPLNTACRYYAYSRLPFMTDTSREYGLTFNRKNMSNLFNSIESLYVQFGINLNIPDLFVVGFEEGNFENLTGQTYGDLDNLCQNSRNHFDKIDSNAIPSNVIVDVVNVGFTVDGKLWRVTSVLTY